MWKFSLLLWILGQEKLSKARAKVHLFLGGTHATHHYSICVFISWKTLCKALIAVRGSSRWIFGWDNVQQSFFLCVLPLLIFRGTVQGSGWVKEKQWFFKRCFTKGLLRSCFPNERPRSFLDMLFKSVYCWHFLKLPSGCLFCFWSLLFHHWFASVLSFVLQQDRK